MLNSSPGKNIDYLIHTTNPVKTKQLIFRNVYVYTCIYVYITTIFKKEALNLEENKEGRWVGLEAGRVRKK